VLNPATPAALPTPAIVSRHSARRLPRAVILLLCVAYVLPGFWGRSPWRSADVTALGVMRELAESSLTWSNWLAPAAEHGALLPYWLGAFCIRWLPFLDQATASRLPFALMLGLTLAAVWYACYNLARQPSAQPVSFAFGGEAEPRDYARAMADAALLALMACLGLAQLAHETTATLAQLCMGALMLFAASRALRLTQINAAAQEKAKAQVRFGSTLGLWVLAQSAMVLSGAPTLALLLGLVLCSLLLGQRQIVLAMVVAFSSAVALCLTYGLELWAWRISPGWYSWRDLSGSGQLLLWFLWPLWPFALWTLWRWRSQLKHPLAHPHLVLPLSFSLLFVASTLCTDTADRTLLLALPALSCLAAFALPTFRRSLAAFVDWFTLLFFSLAGLCIWVIWLAMQTGYPPQPAANVARLAPGFVASVSVPSLILAMLASAAWLWLVSWRVGRHRPAIWSSLVLPAGGAVLCWVLLMSLWLPLLDYARSYAPLAQKLNVALQGASCVHTVGLSPAQRAGLSYHLQHIKFDHDSLSIEKSSPQVTCDFWLVDSQTTLSPAQNQALRKWSAVRRLKRFADKAETILVYQLKPEHKLELHPLSNPKHIPEVTAIKPATAQPLKASSVAL
jgi:4-amino-4-deoxy-L-arabinose transferase-like glycosyltransferase